jgi:hypothetical protein
VDGEEAREVAVVDAGVEHREGLGLPGELAVALVAGQHRAHAAGRGHERASLVEGEDAAARVGRGVDPDQAGVRGDRIGVVERDGAGAGRQRADLVGGVGAFREDDRRAVADAEQRRQPADELLGAHHGHHRGVGQRHGGPPTLEVAADGGARGGIPPDRRVAGRVAGGGQRVDGDPGRRVDGRADGEVDDAVRVSLGGAACVGERVPGEVGQPLGERHHSP